VDVIIWGGFQLSWRIAEGDVMRVGCILRRTRGNRIVRPELLDDLQPDDPRAVRSRRDLRRVNAWMGNERIMFRVLSGMKVEGRPPIIAELGAGDGTLMLKLAKRLCTRWPGARVLLIDRYNLLAGQTAAEFERLGWRVEPVAADVFDWLASAENFDVAVANLFLHHFETDALRRLLELMAQKAKFITACEPRRFKFAKAAFFLVGLIGCGAITRHDAVVSVRAGFTGRELSALWPGQQGWQLHEGAAGFFSHCFSAWRPA
jgi:hypothetical protein